MTTSDQVTPLTGLDESPRDSGPIKVLVVEDDPQDCDHIRGMLAEATADFEIVEADRVEDALQLMQQHKFDTVLLDLSLPEGGGLDVLRRAQVAASAIPIVVMTNQHDENMALKAVRAGAQDYLVKGQWDAQLLVRTILYAVERHRMMMELHAARRQQQFLASHDSLTGLYNRSAFEDGLGRALVYARRQEKQVGLFFLDLDGFKSVNDGLGHPAGDEVLKTVAQRLSGWLRRSDMAARLGGDEFVLMIQDIQSGDVAAKIAARLLQLLSEPFHVADQDVGLSASIGIVIYPDDGTDPEALMRDADIAMYHAKSGGKNKYEFFSQAQNVTVSKKLQLETRLRSALAHDEFLVYYQPIVDASTGRLAGAEALLRWEDAENGLIGADKFIPAAEESGLIGPIGEWVLRAVCKQWKAWQSQGLLTAPVSVNLSTQQFQNVTLIESLVRILEETGLTPDLLELELTETTMAQDTDVPIEMLTELRTMGIGLALDDFGTGYSSISRLHAFPFDRVKIDRSFIKGIPSDPDSAAITAAMIAMAHSLGLRVVAEGVETSDQLAFLVGQGCDEIQGFLFSKALPAKEFVQWLSKRS